MILHDLSQISAPERPRMFDPKGVQDFELGPQGNQPAGLAWQHPETTLVSEPNWIFSPLVAELECVVGAFRDAGKVANYVTLTGLLDAWSGLVDEVERGYEDSIYEYANYVDSRAILDRVAGSASPQARDALRLWLQPWDERYETATVRATAPFHGKADTASQWHWRIPRRLVGELKSDLKAMGLAPND